MQRVTALHHVFWCTVLLAPMTQALVVSRSQPSQCPMDYSVPRSDGTPSGLHLASVANFMLPKVQDRWWNEAHVNQYRKLTDTFYLAPSKIAGCGAFAKRKIAQGEKVGVVWVKDPDAGEFADILPRHFTPWFGRAINHCNMPSSHLESDEKGTVFTVASRDIEAGEEITGDYNEAAQQFPHLVERAPAGWT